MKKVLSLFAILLLSGGLALATVLQHRQEEHQPERPNSYSSHSTHPDGLMLIDGHVMRIKNMGMAKLKKRIVLHNGTSVAPNGMCTDRRGRKRMLRENEHLNMNGKRVMMKRDKRE